MNTGEHNQAQWEHIIAAKDRLKWKLGVELGRDPMDSVEDLKELEMRLAHWLLFEGGGSWLAQLIQTEK